MTKATETMTMGKSRPTNSKTSAKKKTASATKATAGSKEGKGGKSPAARISTRIEELGDWRGETLARIRKIVKQADPDVVEKWKYRGVPVWYHDGIICTGETYQDHVKMTFAKGASLDDPSRLFNATLKGDTLACH